MTVKYTQVGVRISDGETDSNGKKIYTRDVPVQLTAMVDEINTMGFPDSIGSEIERKLRIKAQRILRREMEKENENGDFTVSDSEIVNIAAGLTVAECTTGERRKMSPLEKIMRVFNDDDTTDGDRAEILAALVDQVESEAATA